MRIFALQTGFAHVKQSFLHAAPGIRGKLALLTPGPFADPIPIRAWVIEHDEHRILVDTGEVATAKNLPFARYLVEARDELPHALAAAGLSASDLTKTIVTHLHSDHVDGAIHVRGPVLVGEREWRDANSLRGKLLSRVTRAPLPAGVEFETLVLDAGPFGAFEHSAALTPDERVVAVATPGHTAGHLSVVAIDDAGRHVLLAGDTTDTLEQLRSRRPDAVAPDPAVQVATIDRILDHARTHPTIYLPTHDPESVKRLEAGATLAADDPDALLA